MDNKRHLSDISFENKESELDEFYRREGQESFLLKAYDVETKVEVGRLFGSPYRGLADLYVHGGYRRIGIGTKLLNLYISIVKEKTTLSQLKFTCQKENKRALNLYEKLGFQFQELEETMLTCSLDLKK